MKKKFKPYAAASDSGYEKSELRYKNNPCVGRIQTLSDEYGTEKISNSLFKKEAALHKKKVIHLIRKCDENKVIQGDAT